MTRRLLQSLLLAILAGMAPPWLRAATAQNGMSTATMVEVARSQLELIQPDTAALMLTRVLDSRNATASEQLRGWTLLGIAELMRGRTQAARFAFRRSLERDPQLRVDSLYYLHSDLRRIFATEREALRLDSETPVFIGLRATIDTTVNPGEGRLVLDVQPRRRTRVTASVTPINRNDPVWADSQVVNMAGTFTWDLMTGGVPLAPGRYTLRVTAADATGRPIQPAIRTLLVTRGAVDTLSTPELESSQLMPDSVPVRRGQTLLAGIALGAGALALSSALGNEELSGSGGGRVVVAGTVSAAALIGFFSGRKYRRVPNNASYNDEVMARHNAAVMEVADENQRRLAQAPLRIRIQTPRGGGE